VARIPYRAAQREDPVDNFVLPPLPVLTHPYIQETNVSATLHMRHGG
jgi:hypothetical protein